MKPSASGRILMWRGGSLWIGLAGEPAGMHAHHAVQISLAALPARLLAKETSALARAYEARASNAALIELALEVVRMLAGAAPDSATAPDPRIAKATALIRERLNGAVALKSIADAVHLSPDRFRHLFMEQMGVGFRPYLLWLRIECALAEYVDGRSLTEAAHLGGFSDSAHFSRTFRKMFGIAPVSVRPE